MKSEHNKKFVSGSTALVMGRVKNGLKSMPQAEIERFMDNSQFLKNAPFLWVSLSYRYGIKNNLKILFQGINKKYGDLDIALELDIEILKWADQNNLELLRDIFMIAALEALIQVGKKYNLPATIFEEERAKYGQIPNTIEECIGYKRSTTSPNHGSCDYRSDERQQVQADKDDENSSSDEKTLVIEYKINEMGTDADLKKRYEVEGMVDEVLQSHHLGYCDGGSIGSGTMEVCCIIKDFENAKQVIEERLKNTLYKDYSEIYQDDQD